MKAVVGISSLMEQLGEMVEQGYDLVEIDVVPGNNADKSSNFINNDLRLAGYNYSDFDAVDLESLPNEED